jgi:membrane protease subunit (stomatin/prohibitin family)
MGLWDKIMGQFIDIIEWTDSSENIMIYRFERQGNEIKNGAKLIVRPGQVAVLVNEGKMVADVFEAGTYELTTQNLPILTTLNSWKYGFNSPFKAEVYFFNMKEFLNQKWGLKNPILVSDTRFGMIELRGFGVYAFKFNDCKRFLESFSSTDDEYTTDQISEQLRSLIVMQISAAIAKSQISVDLLAAAGVELSNQLQSILNPIFISDYGLNLTKFYVENISMPEDVKKEIIELSRLGKGINYDELAKKNIAHAIKSGGNSGHTNLGADAMSMMMGMNVANQMLNNQQQHQTPQSLLQTPPPLPTQLQLFVAINGQQNGPFDLQTITQLIHNRQLTKETLVWKQGMANWIAASELAELSNIFAATPPPLA